MAQQSVRRAAPLILLAACIAERPLELAEPTWIAARQRSMARPLCAASAAPDVMRCHARARTDARGNAVTSPTPIPGSLTPADLRRAYRIPRSGGKGVTIAVVAAADNPRAGPD